MRRKLSIETPTGDMMVRLASLAKGAEYRTEGRTLEWMVLADKSLREIPAIVTG